MVVATILKFRFIHSYFDAKVQYSIFKEMDLYTNESLKKFQVLNYTKTIKYIKLQIIIFVVIKKL